MGDGRLVKRGCGKSVVEGEKGNWGIGCVIFIIGCVSGFLYKLTILNVLKNSSSTSILGKKEGFTSSSRGCG